MGCQSRLNTRLRMISIVDTSVADRIARALIRSNTHFVSVITLALRA